MLSPFSEIATGVERTEQRAQFEKLQAQYQAQQKLQDQASQGDDNGAAFWASKAAQIGFQSDPEHWQHSADLGKQANNLRRLHPVERSGTGSSASRR